MSDKTMTLKRIADAERNERTELIKSMLAGASQMISLGTFLFGHPNLIGWVPKDRRIYLAIGEADIEFTKADAIADPGRYAWKRSELATNAASLCLLRAVPGHHLKYVLVDPFSVGARGLLLTSNLTPSGVGVESLSDAKVSSHEMAIELSGEETHELAKLARYTLFGAKGVREFKRGGLQPVSPVPVKLADSTSLLVNGYGRLGLTAALLECVSSAKSSVRLCTYTFDADSALFPVLRKLASSGVDVRVMLNNSLANKRISDALSQVGIKVVSVDRMHAKAVLVDDSSGIVCTSNFCRPGLTDGINIGVRCSSAPPGRLDRLKRFFADRS